MSNLPPYLFPSVDWFLQGTRKGIFKVAIGGRFEKQTARSRFIIAGPNKLQTLSVPLVHGTEKNLQDMRISRDQKWEKEHLKAIETAYGNAPFYEFYDYRVLPLLSNKDLTLLDLIMESIRVMHKEFKCTAPLEFVEESDFEEPAAISAPYSQVFDDRFGFRAGVSALDLLFNLGPEAGDYLIFLAAL